MDKKVEKVRSPNFSLWLCTQKRNHKFRWVDMAAYMGVSCQCIHSYANGTSHPQLLKFYTLCEYISLHTNKPINTIFISALAAIKQDRK